MNTELITSPAPDWKSCWDQICQLRRDVQHLTVSIAMNRPRVSASTDLETADMIKCVIASKFSLRIEILEGKRRPEHIAWPRQIAFYLCRELTQMVLADIGGLFGGKDHGTVLYGCKRVQGRIDTEPATRMLVNELTKMIVQRGRRK